MRIAVLTVPQCSPDPSRRWCRAASFSALLDEAYYSSPVSIIAFRT